MMSPWLRNRIEPCRTQNGSTILLNSTCAIRTERITSKFETGTFGITKYQPLSDLNLGEIFGDFQNPFQLPSIPARLSLVVVNVVR